jgi:hypothetical protein
MTRTAMLVGTLLAATRMAASAACGDVAGDDLAVTAARGAVEVACPCATAEPHGEYVRCAAAVVRLRTAGGMLRNECARSVRRCVRRSTCGRPGAVTCCRTGALGRTKCNVRRDAAACTAPSGGQACVGAFTSCCDACGPSGCVPTTTVSTSSTTTTTTTLPAPCGGGPFACAGACAAGLACAPIADFPPYCGCVPDGSQPCESATVPHCNGTCGGGGTCGPAAIFQGSACICVPSGSTPCGLATYPVCGGACPGTSECQGFNIDTLIFCACAAPEPCACGVPGTCPGDEVCHADPPCGCEP